LKEKFEDGRFVKMKAHLIADGRMQHRTVNTDFSSPTAKKRSVMTCIKLVALKKWEMLKVDIGGLSYVRIWGIAVRIHMEQRRGRILMT
jgi:hypothetical protein